MTDSSQKREDVIQSKEFSSLIKKRWTIALAMTGLMLTVYIGYLLLITYHKEFLASQISGGYTLGLPVGLGIIIFAWLMTGVYAWWANRYYDKDVEALKNRL